MNETLPQVIDDFFVAKNRHDAVGMVECFTADAAVRDEGENLEMRGTDEIRRWLTETVDRYKLAVEVTGMAENEGEFVVTALVSGNFPGSPIPFDYEIRLKGGKIADMKIK